LHHALQFTGSEGGKILVSGEDEFVTYKHRWDAINGMTNITKLLLETFEKYGTMPVQT
jgi:hypothetical protein